MLKHYSCFGGAVTVYESNKSSQIDDVAELKRKIYPENGKSASAV
jgi:hypothetical protein